MLLEGREGRMANELSHASLYLRPGWIAECESRVERRVGGSRSERTPSTLTAPCPCASVSQEPHAFPHFAQQWQSTVPTRQSPGNSPAKSPLRSRPTLDGSDTASCAVSQLQYDTMASPHSHARYKVDLLLSSLNAPQPRPVGPSAKRSSCQRHKTTVLRQTPSGDTLIPRGLIA